MTERIDHAAEARIFERSSDAVVAGSQTAMAPHMIAVIELDKARLHAQLAMVEQQRIANMLALARIESENSATPTDALDAIYDREEPTTWVGSTKLHTRPEIREALGLPEHPKEG